MYIQHIRMGAYQESGHQDQGLLGEGDKNNSTKEVPSNDSDWSVPWTEWCAILSSLDQYAQSHTVERTQTVLGPDTQNSHFAKSVSQDRQSCVGLPRPFLGNDLAFLQPDILDFCTLVPTLVKGWTAPLRDLNYFSLTLSSQPGITPKPI